MLLLLSSALLISVLSDMLCYSSCNDANCDECLRKLGLLFAGACLLTRALLSFKRWGDETLQAGRFFAIFAALLVELTIDNAFTWYSHSLVNLHACHVCRHLISMCWHVSHAHDNKSKQCYRYLNAFQLMMS